MEKNKKKMTEGGPIFEICVFCIKRYNFMQVDWSKLFSYINKGADRDTIIEVENWRKKDVRNEDFYWRVCDYYKNSPTHNESFSEEQLTEFYSKMQKSRKT